MLALSNIDAGYGGFQALFDVSMTVEAGEAVAVIGANGAGKTTLLRVISGLLPASRGDMTMEGVRLTERLAYVYGLFPRLKERRNQLAGTMSGGEQQMCAIARALMSGPKLVLLDEPSMGLAPVVVQQVFELVRRIRAEGYTVLIVEQNVAQVLKIVDRAYLLEVGRIKASGPAAELLASDDVRRAYMGL